MLISETNISMCFSLWRRERFSAYGGKMSAVPEEILMSMYQAETILTLITFPALDSLYSITRNIPSPWTNSCGMGGSSGGSYGLYWSMPLSPGHYILLRTILSLVSDIHLSSEALINIGNLMELETPIQLLFDSVRPFRDVRNFFTHLDEVLSEPDIHGVTGPIKTNCGIVYTDTAKGCRHLVLAGDKIHFTYRRGAKEVDIGKSAFNGIFESARLIYAELTSHKLNAEICAHPPADSLYPL